MCIHPIRKRNPNFVKGVSTSREFISFPCGHCSECQEQRILQWQIRGFHEYVNTKKANGHVFFLTFTYNRFFIPLMQYTDVDLNLHTISTWNTCHIKNCFKRLRRAFEREYNVHCEVRYLFTCERGSNGLYIDDNGKERRATARPHYHAIVTINGCPLSYDECLALIRRCWSNYDPATHTRSSYGNVYNEAITRTPEQAIKYVCKYVVKSSYYDKVAKLLPYFVRHNQSLVDGKDMLPRLHVSKHFGINPRFASLLFTDGVPSANLLNAEIPNPWDKSGNSPVVQLPAYYQSHYLTRTSRNEWIGNELRKKWYVKHIDSQLCKHRAALVNGEYVEAHTTYETSETFHPVKSLGTPLQTEVLENRLSRFLDKRIKRLRTFVQYFPTSIINFQENEYLSNELLALYSLTLSRILGKRTEFEKLLSDSKLQRYLFYEYTHFPHCHVSPTTIKHRLRVDSLHELNEAYTAYSNVQKQLKRMLSDKAYKMQLPRMIQEHPELFALRDLSTNTI